MYPLHKRQIVQDIFNDVCCRKSWIVHGPFHSAKTSMLYEVIAMLNQRNADLKLARIEWRYISLDNLNGWTQGSGLQIDRSAFFKFISFMIFEEKINEEEFKERLFSEHVPAASHEEKSGRLCLLIDEMQEAIGYKDPDMQNGVHDFFRFLCNSGIPFVGAGTFTLTDWNWCQSLLPVTPMPSWKLPSPFNKAAFRQWPAFTSKEVAKILDKYERRIGHIANGLRPLIHTEANGHAASLMALLRLVRDEGPTAIWYLWRDMQTTWMDFVSRLRRTWWKGKTCVMPYEAYWYTRIGRGKWIWKTFLKPTDSFGYWYY